jgi:type I restriction enzyme S subunit
MNCKPYPKYKESSVEWLGQIPEKWGVIPLRYAFLNLDYRRIPLAGVDRADLEKKYPYYGASGVIDYVEDYIFDETLILVAEDGANLLSRSTPLAFLATGKYWVNNHAHILKPISGDIGYWVGVLQTFDYTPLITGAAQPKLTADRLGSILLPKPPGTEQTAIADFLDRETGRIDTLVAKKRRLIALLGEKRTALISCTVTRGLPADAAREFGLEPHTRFKDSGHPWLGEIPESWDPRRIKEISELVGRIGFRGYSTDDLVDEGEGSISMSPSNMIDGAVDLSKCTWLSWEKYFESPEIQIKQDDVVMVKTGSTIGKTAYVESVTIPMTINPQLMIFKDVKCNKKFLYYYVSSEVIQDVIPLHNTGSTIPTMTQAGIGKLPFPLPSGFEQTAIATYLDHETAKIDQLVAKVEAAIARLLEYRTALITAAVTGKIDVRDCRHSRENGSPEEVTSVLA